MSKNFYEAAELSAKGYRLFVDHIIGYTDGLFDKEYEKEFDGEVKCCLDNLSKEDHRLFKKLSKRVKTIGCEVGKLSCKIDKLCEKSSLPHERNKLIKKIKMASTRCYD